MQNVILTIHLLLALSLTGVVLLQRSEGGIGMGGGGPMGGTSARARPNPLTRITWMLAVAFLVTSLTLTIMAASGAGRDSIVGADGAPAPLDSSLPLLPGGLTPPSVNDSAVAPPPAE